MIDHEEIPKHQKVSQKKTPPKAKHKHEYIHPYARAYIRFENGTRSAEKRSFYLRPRCIECGHIAPYKRSRAKQFVEVEISWREYKKMRNREDELSSLYRKINGG